MITIPTVQERQVWMVWFLVNNDDNKASTDATIAVSGNKFDIHVVFNQAESNLKVAKKTVGKATLNDDGTLNQTYQVDIACKNDNISDLVLSDEAGSALSDATNFVYNGATYGSLAELSTAIGSTMTKDQKISFTYDMKVDASVLEQGTNHYTGSETNKFKTEYKTNKGNSKTSDSNSVNLDLDMPSVSKNGTYDSTTGKVTWKITVTPGVVGWDKVDMSGVTDKVTEMLGVLLSEHLRIYPLPRMILQLPIIRHTHMNIQQMCRLTHRVLHQRLPHRTM